MSTDIRARLLAVETSCLCDSNRSLRVLDSAIRPMRAGLRMAGRARVVECRGDFLAVIEALAASTAGDVLVVDAASGPLAVAGELFATEAHRRQLAGIVVDGAVRDVATLRSLDLPVYARSISPKAGTRVVRGSVVSVVTCGGIEIANGEWVVGDDDGVVVLSEAEAAAVLPGAERIQEAERRILDGMAGGRGLFDLIDTLE